MHIQMSHKEQEIYFKLLNREKKVVSVKLLVRDEKDMSVEYARKLLFSMSKKGALYRVAKGCYIVIPPDMIANPSKYIGDPYAIIDQLMEIFGEKYYVGYQNAAHLHGIAEQIPFVTTVVITTQRRPLRIGQQILGFRKVSSQKFFGIQRMKYADSFVNVSNLEKTILDCFERSELCGGIDEVARILSNAVEKLNDKKIIEYLLRYHSPPLYHRLGFVLDKLLQSGYSVSEKLLAELKNRITGNVYPLDPRAGSGKISGIWRINENVDCMRWLHA